MSSYYQAEKRLLIEELPLTPFPYNMTFCDLIFYKALTSSWGNHLNAFDNNWQLEELKLIPLKHLMISCILGEKLVHTLKNTKYEYY